MGDLATLSTGEVLYTIMPAYYSLSLLKLSLIPREMRTRELVLWNGRQKLPG
jgi:hypothetical protein